MTTTNNAGVNADEKMEYDHVEEKKHTYAHLIRMITPASGLFDLKRGSSKALIRKPRLVMQDHLR